MSSSHREAVFNFFVEKGILLKDEWLSACLEFLYGRSVLRNQQPARVNALVFEQWLNTDLVESSDPAIEQIKLDLSAQLLELPSQLILQIISLTDIGMAAHAQLNGFTHDMVDDSGFEPLQEKDQESNITGTSKRCLLFEASDGANHVKLLEYYQIPSFSLNIRPGAKILILPKTRIRSGTFYLTAKNCQLLGGEVEKYASGLPIDMLRKRLNLTSLGTTSALTGKENVAANAQERPSPPVSVPISCETTNKMDQKAPINDKKDATLIGSISTNTGFSLLDDDDFEDNTNDDSTKRNQVSFMDSQSLTIEEEDSFDAPTPSELQRLREYQNARRIEQQLSTPSTCLRQQKEQTPPLMSDFSMTDELPPTPSPRRHYDEPVINRQPLQTKNLFSAPPIKRSRLSMLTTIKQEPDDIEVINLDDEDDDWKPAPKTLQGALEQYDRNESGEIERGKETPKRSGKVEIHEDRWGAPSPNVRPSVSESPILTAFKELKIVYIADALKQMRYAVGSLKRNVQGVIERVVEPLKIVDGLWTQTVAIRDESTSPEGVNCIIAGKVLEQLIGMGPDEATEIRRSASVQRRSEGKARVVALQHAMERLDLIFEIEFFSRREVTPVICDLQTLAQKLNML